MPEPDNCSMKRQLGSTNSKGLPVLFQGLPPRNTTINDYSMMLKRLRSLLSTVLWIPQPLVSISLDTGATRVNITLQFCCREAVQPLPVVLWEGNEHPSCGAAPAASIPTQPSTYDIIFILSTHPPQAPSCRYEPTTHHTLWPTASRLLSQQGEPHGSLPNRNRYTGHISAIRGLLH
jgi:hypothetical protein